MPRQLDQLPPDATSLARRLASLEREVREMRAARRMTAASVGTLRVYADDGTTLLAELGPDAGNGGGGLWTRGLQDPINMSGYLSSGQLQFRPVEDGQVAVPAGITYDSDAFQYTDLILTSGNVASTAHRAMLTLESTFEGGHPYVYVQAEDSNQCNMDVLGVLTAANIAYGTINITPSPGVPTSFNVTGLNLMGSTFTAFATAQTSLPGTQVTGVGVTNVSATGLTVWLTRTNNTSTGISWMVMGI
ncbi:hypothetical protein [Streptomyces olivochromogenes]|uniref:Uncharacterized protein n=1 Tax=Streptomyces olivochromogenes TaxID=1963 RepID=A0A250VTI6_STROL|nr:hypothetical protein [Streptomyces olivochromogenes]KUN38219.1 hypothetical protein AQJ27_44770 [Streptomyces olivochromogenes]GAX57342.1 hypothetical protein SO3561_08912 [Streptomyces olivochromogenes]